MAEANAKVMEMIEAELKKNPDISNKELREKAQGMDKGIGKLSARQFNATYPLQVKRAMAPPRKRNAGGRKKKTKRSRTGAGASRGRRAGTSAGSSRGRTAAAGGGARAGAGAAGGADREQVRKVLVQLARDVAEGDRGALVEVAAGIDRYVDRVLKATG